MNSHTGEPRTLLLCRCENTMQVDGKAIGRALGIDHVETAQALCTGNIDTAVAAMETGGKITLACGQMAHFFDEIAAEIAQEAGATGRTPPQMRYTDIRDRAGWTADKDATAKQAALLAEEALPRPETPSRDVVSEGRTLVIGASDIAMPVAETLGKAGHAVTVLVTDPASAMLLPDPAIQIITGHIRNLAGALGGFSLRIDGFAAASPAGRALSFGTKQDGARTTCDIVVDLTGEQPLTPAPEKREGYFRAAPNNAVAIEAVTREAMQAVGVFEKPLFIRFDESLCAHSRSGQTGCTRCLDICPTGAITPDGESVRIDPDICAGCGACAAVCPSGAASYDDPPVAHLFDRLTTLATTYAKAGGTGAPRLLVHDDTNGSEAIRYGARYFSGLPADVIPLAVHTPDGFGHAEMLAAIGAGFGAITLLAGQGADRTVIEAQIELATAILAGTGETPPIEVIELGDPEAMIDHLIDAPRITAGAARIIPAGGRRETTRLVAKSRVEDDTTPVPLPAGAPYGTIAINKDACTLCLSCVSLCPSGALGDHPDRPEVSIRENACLQCGICETACPESAIDLVPQLNLANSALENQSLHGEAPFDCVRCGTPFGVKSTIEAVTAKLENHPMFQGTDRVRLIQMCDNCRVAAQFEGERPEPFTMGDRPIRTH